MKTLKKAQQFIEFATLSLEDNADFAPFIMVMDERDREFFIGFDEMPTEDEAKDALADMMIALCIVHGAVEVVFGSSAWSVQPATKEDMKLPPSKNPKRKEVAIVSAANSAGVKDVRIASMVRENGKVGIGLWEQPPLTAIAGRFPEALHMGLKLSSRMPHEVRDFLREHIEAGLMEEVVSSTMSAIIEARRGAMTIERMWEK